MAEINANWLAEAVEHSEEYKRLEAENQALRLELETARVIIRLRSEVDAPTATKYQRLETENLRLLRALHRIAGYFDNVPIGSLRFSDAANYASNVLKQEADTH